MPNQISPRSANLTPAIPITTMKSLFNLLLLISISAGICFRPSDNIVSRSARPTTSPEESMDDDTNSECFEPLQIPCEINGYIIPAIVDTGAQITVMSESCARRCRVSNLIDGRFCGQAVGMGSSDILGRISELPMRVGPISYHNRVSILRESRVDLILGLDFLRRFKSEINLEGGILKLNVRGKVVRISFIGSDNGPLRLSRGDNGNSEEDVVLEMEDSSMDDDAINRDSGSDDDYHSQKIAPIRGGYSNRSCVGRKLQDGENSWMPQSKLNSFDDMASEEGSDDNLKKYSGLSMEGV